MDTVFFEKKYSISYSELLISIRKYVVGRKWKRQHYKKKVVGISLEARIREGDWEKFGMGEN